MIPKTLIPCYIFNTIQRHAICTEMGMRSRLPETSRKNQSSSTETETPNERQLLIEALRRNDWNLVRTAESLHVAEAELSRMLRRYGLHDGL
jgi:transcriptional regulator with GAF, ATPase, and Fis domain